MDRETAYEFSVGKFERARQTFESKINLLYSLEGFDADGLTDIYPEILDVNSLDGNYQLKRYLKLIDGLSKSPKLTMISRVTTNQIEFDSFDSTSRSVDQRWVRVYENLTPEAFKFLKGEDSELVSINIDAYTLGLGDGLGIESTRDVVFDVPHSPTSLWGKENEWQVPPDITFADSWEELIQKSSQLGIESNLIHDPVTEVLILNYEYYS